MSRFNAAAGLRSLPKEPLEIWTRSGAHIDGVWSPGADVLDRTIRAVVQPASPDTLKNIESSGEELVGAIDIHTTATLRTVSEDDQLPADLVLYKGRRYKVIVAGDWSQYGLNRYTAGVFE